MCHREPLAKIARPVFFYLKCVQPLKKRGEKNSNRDLWMVDPTNGLLLLLLDRELIIIGKGAQCADMLSL